MNRLLLAILFTAFLTGSHVAWAATGAENLEYEIKTGYLYNFINLVEWPKEKMPEGSDIIVGIYGGNPFGRALTPLNGKVAKGRKIQVMEVSTVAELARCQVVFVSQKEAERLQQLLPQLQSGVLTIGETQNFARNGGIINFFEERNKVRFEINREAARTAGLNISSELLKLARLVKS